MEDERTPFGKLKDLATVMLCLSKAAAWHPESDWMARKGMAQMVSAAIKALIADVNDIADDVWNGKPADPTPQDTKQRERISDAGSVPAKLVPAMRKAMGLAEPTPEEADVEMAEAEEAPMSDEEIQGIADTAMGTNAVGSFEPEPPVSERMLREHLKWALTYIVTNGKAKCCAGPQGTRPVTPAEGGHSCTCSYARAREALEAKPTFKDDALSTLEMVEWLAKRGHGVLKDTVYGYYWPVKPGRNSDAWWAMAPIELHLADPDFPTAVAKTYAAAKAAEDKKAKEDALIGTIRRA